MLLQRVARPSIEGRALGRARARRDHALDPQFLVEMEDSLAGAA
jgi:hypothetical protein